MVKFVIVESPYAPPKDAPEPEAKVILERNLAYARAAMRDCFLRGEVPFASHALYTQPKVLDDTIPAQRAQGIKAGFDIATALQVAAHFLPFLFSFTRAFYTDRDWSPGMRQGQNDAIANGQRVEERVLGPLTWSRDTDFPETP